MHLPSLSLALFNQAHRCRDFINIACICPVTIHSLIDSYLFAWLFLSHSLYSRYLVTQCTHGSCYRMPRLCTYASLDNLKKAKRVFVGGRGGEWGNMVFYAQSIITVTSGRRVGGGGGGGGERERNLEQRRKGR